jgi:hypothetical protein
MLGFFEVTDGRWVQARLQKTYRTVEAKVAKNRANGAKGGTAKAAKERAQKRVPKPLESKGRALANGHSGAISENNSKDHSQDVATKTKDQNQSSAEAVNEDGFYDLPDSHIRIASTAGLDTYALDFSPANAWLETGRKVGKGRGEPPASLEKDILPTIARIRTRELDRRGEAPTHLAYYTAAITEARDVRLGRTARPDGTKGTIAPSVAPVPMSEKRVFDHAAVADWQVLLGDASSRFQGDYMAKHWFIPDAHPTFRPISLGPNPAFDVNPAIPAEIYQAYGTRWHWLRAKEMSSERQSQDGD